MKIEKKAYSTPTLTSHGLVQSMTQNQDRGGSGGFNLPFPIKF